MVGACQWAVACRFGELSQQPTWPQCMHRRRCTHPEPMRTHSSQPSPDGVTSLDFVEVRTGISHDSGLAVGTASGDTVRP